MNRSVHPFLERYTREDGTLIWKDPTPNGCSVDDLYESFYNWPLLYILGGADDLLPLSLRQWKAMTRQLTDFGVVYKEYGRGTDWFHQAEGDMYFHLLCLADPANPEIVERAQRFAGFYLNEDSEAPNYDPERKLVRSPRSGSGGPQFWGGEAPSYAYSPGMARYGLPYEDVPGVRSIEDLKDPELARRMGQTMQARMSQGDVVANLAITSLVTNAYLLTGLEKYRHWVIEYVDAWMERARQNDGLLPDNIGLSGRIGEYVDGKWYGGLYGWTWPHGFYNVAMAAIVAATNALLLTQDDAYLDLPRAQIDRVLENGRVCHVDELDMRLEEHWVGILAALDETLMTFAVPYGYRDSGWFDYQPMSPIYPVAVWNASQAAADWSRIERIRQSDRYDWGRVVCFRGKEDAGHEAPWVRFLMGQNPSYPEAILSTSYGLVCRRLEQIRENQEDLTQVHEHHWQELNPVTTEALVQLTLGAPQMIYNGGLLLCRVRYFDVDRRRPGLPLDVAALVSKLEAGRTSLKLVNLDPFQARTLIIQAGAFGEHHFSTATYRERVSEYPGIGGSYAAPALHLTERTVPVSDKHLQVHMPPATEIELDLETARFVHQPSYALPWEVDC